MLVRFMSLNYQATVKADIRISIRIFVIRIRKAETRHETSQL